MAVLPEGGDSDSKLESVRTCINRLRELQPKLDNKIQLASAKSCTRELSELFDPSSNPAGYRLCQDEAAKAGGIEVLLQQGSSGKDDALRSLSLETVARMSFGNACTTEMAASAAELLPVLQNAIRSGLVPERLSALQLAQAIAASSSAAAAAVVPQLVPEAVSLLSDNHGFDQLSHAALDLLVSCSFSHPEEVLCALGWQQLRDLLTEGDGRPTWLPHEPLEVLIGGLLATNCLAASQVDEDSARSEVAQSLERSNFLQHFVECLDAAVQRRAWPDESSCFHSPRRLAEVARKLAETGFNRQLVSAVALLVQIVETSQEDGAQLSALLALRRLCADVRCLEVLLAQEEFRRGAMDALHRSEPAATDLLSYMEFVENALTTAQAAKDAQAKENPDAPSVLQLAEIFQNFAPLDGKMDSTLLTQACAQVPLAPAERVRASLGSSADDGLSLQSFLQNIYGTPTILGWWPSLMQDAAASLAAKADVPRLPSLAQAAAIFEAAAEGRSALPIQALHDAALPALGFESEGTVVEVKFSELNGSAPLAFRAFVEWLGELCVGLAEADAEAQAEAEA